MRAVLLAAFLASTSAAAQPQALTLESSIALPDVSGRIDHMAVDLARGHLFVAELGNGTVDVVDLARRKVIHRISGLKEPQGVVYEPKSDSVAVAAGGDGTVRLYSGKDFSPRGVIRLGDDADNVRVDPRNGLLVVGYGSGALAVIDPDSAKKLRDIALPGHPESFRLSGSRVFVNVPDAGRIVVANLDSGKATDAWAPQSLTANFPMILDGAGHVAVVFRAPARLVLFDAASGKLVAKADTCGDSDDVFLDSKRQLFYVSCGAGKIDVFGPGLSPVQRLDTSWGARTSLWVPELDRLFVASRAGLLGSEASLLVYRPGP
jgi:YVTN family beta-propeller protein